MDTREGLATIVTNAKNSFRKKIAYDANDVTASRFITTSLGTVEALAGNYSTRDLSVMGYSPLLRRIADLVWVQNAPFRAVAREWASTQTQEKSSAIVLFIETVFG